MGAAEIVVDVHGIGLAVSVPRETAFSLGTGSEVYLHTVLIPREDEWTLYGFVSPAEKELFQLVRSVSGVGPRTALAVLSTMSVDAIATAVAGADAAAFTAVPGIGAKTANLIIVSLTGKMPRTAAAGENDLLDALTGLGWSRDAARDAARVVMTTNVDASLPERIRLALRMLGGER